VLVSTTVEVGGPLTFQVIALISDLESFLVVLPPFPQIFLNSLGKSGFVGANYLLLAVLDTSPTFVHSSCSNGAQDTRRLST
jgi:hypothetical protein